MRKFFFLLAWATLIGSCFTSLRDRLIWTSFAIAFLVAADKIKDVEKIKRREREITEIRMRTEMLNDFEQSLSSRYQFMMEHLTKAMENALSQVSTYVRDASPTRKR